VRFRVLLGALALVVPGICHASPAAKTAASETHARGGNAAPAIPDAQIEKDIRARLAASAKISLDHFTVHVQGGVATLEGQTSVVQHKGTATRMAKSAGAVRVVNRIQVSEEAREKASANLTEGRRRAQIKRSETTARSETGQSRKTR
jgi:hypothetical protein